MLPRIGAPGLSPPTEQDILGTPPHQQSAHSTIGPPLPRPRPATLVAVKPSQDTPPAATENVSHSKPENDKPDVAATTPMVKPRSALPSAKPGKGPVLPAIND
jgi:hypothetical protein